MESDEARAKVELANARYLQAREEADQAAADLVAACAEAARSGHSIEDLAGETGFTAAELRRRIRELGTVPEAG
ncbi:hypothetical protein DZF91_25905 [Actinomadura logoneensis]|uniref:Uncharacterized protein n=1 Tax=Actinomadura logoneensis TaxID=2293572 RepID=A0A372JFJ3_9ACTN|nr:hypothetical protein [Actinomadura logoneensis]RFU38777.1 hypothetical protein DZF91_25905 [Actinomadura logoneensis]